MYLSQNCQKLGLECRRADVRKPPAATGLLQSHPPTRGSGVDVQYTQQPGTVTDLIGLEVSNAPLRSPRRRPISPLTYSLATHGLPPEWSQRESSMMYGIVGLVEKMQHANGHLLNLGASGLPM